MITKTVSVPSELRSEHRITRIVAAFGVFDGVHVGHQRILSQVLHLAEGTSAVPTVITFDTHPRAIVSADAPPPRLTTIPQRLRLLASAGIEAVVLLPFGPAMAAMSPESFLHSYVFAHGGPDVVGVCIGSGWRFGNGGKGNVQTLAAVAASFGCRVVSVPEVLVDGRIVSSTRIREAVQAGELGRAAILLGRPFTVSGTVVHGKGIGQATLGCPTANLQDHDLLLPPSGVYAARARLLARDTIAPGVVYVGNAPTFTAKDSVPGPRVVEIHLFGTSDSLYGEEMDVEFVSRIRPDQRFNSVDELRAQMRSDLRTARSRLGLPTDESTDC